MFGKKEKKKEKIKSEAATPQTPENTAAPEAPKGGKRKIKINSGRLLRRLTVTAVCTAFAVILKCFTNLALNIPGLGIKIGISGIFNFFPAALCGPLYGGAASALTDLLGILIAPDGAYIPWLTVTAFLGGCTVGLIWRFLNRRASRTVRAVLLSVFSVVLIFGISANISLCRDGVMNGVLAKQSSLPYREEIDSAELSPLSRFVTGLSRYSKDSKSLSLKSHPATAENAFTELPASITVNGETRKITSVSANALANISGTVLIPETYTSISEKALGKDSKVTAVAGKPDSAAQEFAKAVGVEFHDIDVPLSQFPTRPFEIPELTAADSHSAIEYNGYSFGQSDTYRKNLAANTNMVVFGSELAGVCGIAFVLINLLITAIPGKKKTEATDTAQSGAFSFLKIAVAVTVSGLLVTTVNTFILRAFIPAWADRSLLILLVPRIAEELIVRLIQAYLISLLYGAVSIGRAGNIMKKLR